MDTTLQINSIKRWLAIKGIEVGIAQIRQIDKDISTKNDGSNLLVSSLTKVDGVLSPVLLDNTYYYTSQDNWDIIIPLLIDITKAFSWEAERFDCDKRATLIASLVSALFRINTCCTAYCRVSEANTNNFKYDHYIITWVDDKGNVWICDQDQNGLSQKIITNDFIMGNCKYHLNQIRTI